MIDESDDNIDKSVWLQRGEQIVTPERVAKGDMRIEYDFDEETGKTGDIRFAQAQERNLLNWLWSHHHLDDQHHHDGQTFQIWRDIHRASLGVTKPVSQGGGEAMGIRLRAYGYVLLTQRMSIYDQKAVERTIETPGIEPFTDIAITRLETYRRAFIRLSDIVPRVKDRIAYLEGLSDAERDAIAEEALKNFVARRCGNV